MRDADKMWPFLVGEGRGSLAWRGGWERGEREKDLVAQGRLVRERVARSWPRIHA